MGGRVYTLLPVVGIWIKDLGSLSSPSTRPTVFQPSHHADAKDGRVLTEWCSAVLELTGELDAFPGESSRRTTSQPTGKTAPCCRQLCCALSHSKEQLDRQPEGISSCLWGPFLACKSSIIAMPASKSLGKV